jgi:transcriptional regulator with XRE-family HTH domain
MTSSDLAAWRATRGLSRLEVARLFGYTRSYIYMIEAGYRRVPPALAARCYGQPTPPLLTGGQVRAWRLRHGISSTALGQAVGLSHNGLTAQERGQRRVSWTVRAYIAAHPDGEPLRSATWSEGAANRAAIAATIRDDGRTVREIRAVLPMRLARETIRQHLHALRAEGRVVRWERNGRVHWRGTLAAGRAS